MDPIEWCNEKISKLLNDEERLPVLQEMKNYFNTISQNEIAKTANTIQLPVVFDCLNNCNTEEVDLACDILTTCMSNLSLGDSTNRYGTFIERALNHPFSSVKIMALKEIKRSITKDDVIDEICRRQAFFMNIIKCIGDTDLSVAKLASEICFTVCSTSNGCNLLVLNDFLKLLHEIMGVNEIVRLRVYEIFIKLSTENEDCFKILELAGLLTLILNELNNNDILLRLNIIEILMALVETSYGYEYLESNQILTKLSKFIDDGSLTTNLCEPNILKFFGNLAYAKPLEIFSKYPNFVQRLFNGLESMDSTIVGIAMDTIGYIATLDEGKVALESSGYMCNFIKMIAPSPSFTTEIKVRSLNCLENLLRGSSDKNILNLTEKWYKRIDENPMDIIWKYAKNPFAELRLGGLGILKALAAQQWAQEIIRDTPGLIEFLLDRKMEVIKDSKEVKYEIVKLLSTSTVFDHLTIKLLQNFVKEGPFYVETVTEVAIEGNE